MSAILKCAPTYECFMRLNIFPQVEFQITGAAFVYFYGWTFFRYLIHFLFFHVNNDATFLLKFFTTDR